MTSLLNNSDKESLNFLLVDVCKIYRVIVDEITKTYRTITELLNSIVKDYFSFELTIDEKRKIYQFGNLQRRAIIDIEVADQIFGDKNTFENVIQYSLDDNVFDKEINNKKKELYNKYKENFMKIYEHEYNKRRKIQKYGNYNNIEKNNSFCCFLFKFLNE